AHRGAAPAARRAPRRARGPRLGTARLARHPRVRPPPAEPAPAAAAADRHLPVRSPPPEGADRGGPGTLTTNGERGEVLGGLTVATLVGQLGIRGRVAVELNGEVLRQAQPPETTLRDGDTLEVVTFVGGGA